MKSRDLLRTSSLLLFFLSVACASFALAQPASQNTTVATKKTASTFAQSNDVIVLISKSGDTLKSLARKHLGDETLAWKIADYNGIEELFPGMEVIIPLREFNPIGVYSNGFQTVPILCYHRFGEGHAKLSVPEPLFRRQMEILKSEGYRVIPLRDLFDFMKGRKSIPQRAVVITIDDGYRSNYDIAFPILREFAFPATIFLYTEFMGARDALSWTQISEMNESGLIDFQPHSHTHPNLSLKRPHEHDAAYKKRLLDEILLPAKAIKTRLSANIHTFAYPYGDTNDFIISQLEVNDYQLGVTVEPGSNPADAPRYMLRRTMVFGDHTVSEFRGFLEVFVEEDLR